MKGQNVVCVFCLALWACAPRQVHLQMPPLPGDNLPRTKKLSAVAKLDSTPIVQKTISLAWDNKDYGAGNTNFETGLVATTNFQDWVEVARVPYQPSILVTLTNRPGSEFYRAFNRLKPLSAAAGAALPERPDLAGYARRLPGRQRY